MKTGFWGIAIAAAFVFGMFVSAGPVYGPHYTTWDGKNFDAYLSTVANKLESANKFFAPPGDVPQPNAGDAEITLKLMLIQDEIDDLQSDLDRWNEWCETNCSR